MALDSIPYSQTDDQDAIPGALDDWYLVCEDLARVWLLVVNDKESPRLEDRIARTKMPYINWAELLEKPFFQKILQKVERDQRKPNAPRTVHQDRMHLIKSVQPLSDYSSHARAAVIPPTHAPEHTPTTPERNDFRLAICFILGVLVGTGSSIAAVRATQTPTQAIQTNR